MISGVHLEVVLALGYVFLVAVAFVLEFLARHSHKRSESYGNSGFVFFQDMDLWECPAGRQLLRAGADYRPYRPLSCSRRSLQCLLPQE